MEFQDISYYPMGLSGDNYLLEQKNQYICSCILSNGLIQWIECDKINKSMKVKTRSENVVEWNALNLNDLIKDDITEHLERRKVQLLKQVY